MRRSLPPSAPSPRRGGVGLEDIGLIRPAVQLCHVAAALALAPAAAAIVFSIEESDESGDRQYDGGDAPEDIAEDLRGVVGECECVHLVFAVLSFALLPRSVGWALRAVNFFRGRVVTFFTPLCYVGGT